VRAQRKILRHAPLARRARRLLLDILQQGLFLQRASIDLGQRLARPQDKVEQQPRQVEDQHQEDGQDAHQPVARAARDIARRPDDQAQDEGYRIGAQGKERDLQHLGHDRWNRNIGHATSPRQLVRRIILRTVSLVISQAAGF